MCVCVCVCARVCIHTPHFLYPSFFDGHLHCFHTLTVVNNGAVNVGCKYLFKLVFLFFLDKCPVVGLLDHMAALFLVF